MKRIKQIGLAAFLTLTAVFMLPQAQAADTAVCGTYKTFVQQGGLYVQATGTAKRLVAPKTGHKVSSCAADTTYIYYTAASTSGKSSSLYRIKPDGSGKQKLAKLSEKQVNLLNAAGDVVYYTASSGSNSVSTRRYSMAKNRSYTVKTDFEGIQYSNGYLVGTPKVADGTPTSLYTVRGLTNQYVRVSRSCVAYQVISSKIYFVEGSSNSITAVKYCDLNGGRIRTLSTKTIKNVNLAQVVPGQKMVYYTSKKTPGTVYGYTYSTKKTTAVRSKLSKRTTLDGYGKLIVVQSPGRNFYTITSGASKAVKAGSLGSGTITNVIGNTYFKNTNGQYTVGTIAA